MRPAVAPTRAARLLLGAGLAAGLCLWSSSSVGAQVLDPLDPPTPAATSPDPAGQPAPNPRSTAPSTTAPAHPAEPGAPAFPPPTVRACSPCAVREQPRPTRLGRVGETTSAPPATPSAARSARSDAGRPALARPAAGPGSQQTFMLPATGAPVTAVAIAGVLLLAAGVAALATAGRRTATSTSAR